MMIHGHPKPFPLLQQMKVPLHQRLVLPEGCICKRIQVYQEVQQSKVKLLQRLLKQDILQDLRQDIWKKTHILTKWWYQKPLLQNACSTSIPKQYPSPCIRPKGNPDDHEAG